MSPTPPLLPPPATRTAIIVRRGDQLEVRAAFPTWTHLYDALLAAVSLSSGLLLAFFAGMARRGLPAYGGPSPGLAVLAVVGAAALLLNGLKLLRGLQPLRLRFGRDGLEVIAPRGVPGTAGERASRVAARGGRHFLPWPAIDGIELAADGLLVRAPAATLFVPWRYGKPAGRIMGIVSDIHYAAFRFDELEWIAGLVERLRQGELEALSDLGGRRAGAGPTSPLWEEPTFVLRGVDATRLRLLVLLGAAALSLWLVGR